MPDFNTIASFRKDNGKAICGVCRQFVVLCQQLGLFSEALVAIDGSKFKAMASRACFAIEQSWSRSEPLLVTS